MLNRQKTLLLLIASARRPVSKMELTKWAFVLREETASQGGSAFYDFLPYKYGPFSFCLYREMDALVRDGYVTEKIHWTSTSLVNELVETLPKAVVDDGERIVERFRKTPVNTLVDYVYSTYPRFTVNSEKERLAERLVASPAVYTAGYEGLSIDAFLDSLIRNGIQRIIDVRNNPVARRYGFHKSTLSRLAGRLDIDYVHVPELGIESSLRRGITSREDYDVLLDRYERETIRREERSVNHVAGLIATEASVLVCMEGDPCLCHRSRLAASISRKTGFPIRDLGAETNGGRF